ncbi:uncharacterized protein LOC135686121 isoform X2 [Rhopilema esculentum]|uniref:uncharacterized protein LOC135686121 isoform X2 n=1 Tax=Rhopilema esculentum TaxID=499914 RepID=UPI0031D9616F
MPHDAQIEQSPTLEHDIPVSKCCSAMFAIQMCFSAVNALLIVIVDKSLDVFILAVVSAIFVQGALGIIANERRLRSLGIINSIFGCLCLAALIVSCTLHVYRITAYNSYYKQSNRWMITTGFILAIWNALTLFRYFQKWPKSNIICGCICCGTEYLCPGTPLGPSDSPRRRRRREYEEIRNSEEWGYQDMHGNCGRTSSANSNQGTVGFVNRPSPATFAKNPLVHPETSNNEAQRNEITGRTRAYPDIEPRSPIRNDVKPQKEVPQPEDIYVFPTDPKVKAEIFQYPDKPNSPNRQIDQAGRKQSPNWQTRYVPAAAATKYENFDILAYSPRDVPLDPHPPDRPSSANRQIDQAGRKQSPNCQTRDVPAAAAAAATKYDNYDIVAFSPRDVPLDPHPPDRPSSANRQIDKASRKQSLNCQTRDVPAAAATKYENFDILAYSPKNVPLDPHPTSRQQRQQQDVASIVSE